MIRVLVADDHPLFREGVKQILAETSDIIVADEASNGREVLAKLGQNHYDVILLDIAMPGESGVEVLKHIKSIKPDQAVLILSMYPEKQYALRILRSGASGYLTKESTPDQLVTAVRRVVAGGRYISPELGEELALRVGKEFKIPRHERLSDREHQVLVMIASGKTTGEIADELSLSAKTVSTYRTRMLEKMNMKTDAELTHYAIQHELVKEGIKPPPSSSNTLDLF
jgi:DNA-binding NarL/FixJ family response regulator